MVRPADASAIHTAIYTNCKEAIVTPYNKKFMYGVDLAIAH